MPAVALATRLQSALVRGLVSLPPGSLRLLVGRPVVRDGQQLDVEAQLGLRLLSLAGRPELDELTPVRARERVASDAATFAGPKLALERVQDIEVAGAEGM